MRYFEKQSFGDERLHAIPREGDGFDVMDPIEVDALGIAMRRAASAFEAFSIALAIVAFSPNLGHGPSSAHLASHEIEGEVFSGVKSHVMIWSLAKKFVMILYVKYVTVK